jgi:hypothetical protein
MYFIVYYKIKWYIIIKVQNNVSTINVKRIIWTINIAYICIANY